MAEVMPIKFELEPGGLIICSAHEEDAEKIIAFMKQSVQETDFLAREPNEFGITVEDEKKFINNTIESERDIFLKAEVNGKIVGTLGFSTKKLNRYKHKGEFGMVVSKDYWGQGIGTKLLEILLDWADENGLVKISLRVDATNKQAIKLYEKFGFRKEGLLEKNREMKDGEYRDELVMALIIKYNL